MSPRGFDILHEAAGLWVLSSVAQERLLTDFGGKLRHTSLLFMVVAKATIWAKTHTINLAKSLLTEAGQDWRLLTSNLYVRSDISATSDNEQEYSRRAWHIKYFNPIGDYSFWTTINEMDDYPCLSVIAEATPVSLKPYASPSAPFWLKVLSRFATIAPAKGEARSRLKISYELTNRTPRAPPIIIPQGEAKRTAL